MDLATLRHERKLDSEGWVHYGSMGPQTGQTLCNMQMDGKRLVVPTTKRAVTCFECLGIVERIKFLIETP